jgi:tripartite-type tricarboxylate transporter receptor subunit TctC
MNRRRNLVVVAVQAAGLALVALSSAATAQPSPTLKGKTVGVNIGFGPGGGYDTYGRVLAAHLGKHLPGNPVVVPRNMPGAGGLRVVNYLYAIAPKDGTELGVFASSTAMEPLMGNEQAKFDPAKLSWLGSMDQDVSYCAVWQGPGAVQSFRELLTKEMTFGDSGPGATSHQHPLILKNVLGAKIRLVSGYEGSRSVNLAMQRGEVNGACGMVTSAIKTQWLDDVNSGRLKLVIQMGAYKASDFGDVPSVYDFVKTEEDKAVLDVHFKQILLSRPVAAPPGLSPEILSMLRAGFTATMADPEFLAQAKTMNASIDPATGEQVQALVAELTNYPASVVKKARTAIER